MAMRRKSFSTYKPQGTDDVVILDLNGIDFPCQSRIPGIVLVEFISQMDEDKPQMAGSAVINFLQASIMPTSWDAFMAHVRDPQAGVGLEELTEICSWLAEQYTGENPTQSSSGSSAGSQTSGPGPSEQPYAQEPTFAGSGQTPSFQ